jgi:hypothetical protein
MFFSLAYILSENSGVSAQFLYRRIALQFSDTPFLTFIQLGKSVKNKFLFTMAAYPGQIG